MKKFLFIGLFILVLTGCKNEMECSLEKDEEGYTLKQDVVLKTNEDDIITSAETTITMTFESAEEAQGYYNIFGELEEKPEIEIDGDVLVIKDSEEYFDKSAKTEVQKQLENSGYKCN